MPVRLESIDKWVRAYVGDTAVVDSRSPMLFYEETFPVPGYAFSESDVRTDLLRPNPEAPAPAPFIFRPKGPITQWFDLDVEARLIPHAAWIRDDPMLSSRLIFSWQPGLIDRWLEEDEEVVVHPRDPHKRVEALCSSRHITVAAGDTVLADSRSPVLLFETNLPTRYYLPLEDVHLEALTPSSHSSVCPYKGEANRYWDVTGQPDARNAAWSYSDPLPGVAKIAGRIAFYNEILDITVDGEPVERPDTVFSKPEQRPGS